MNFWSWLTVMGIAMLLIPAFALFGSEKGRVIYAYMLVCGMVLMFGVILVTTQIAPETMADFSIGRPMSFFIFATIALLIGWAVYKHYKRVHDPDYPVNFKQAAKEAEAMRVIGDVRGWAIAALPRDAMDPETGRQFTAVKRADWRYASAWLADPNHKYTDIPSYGER